MVRARRLGVLTPVVFHVDQEAYTIAMEQVHGRPLKYIINEQTLGADGKEGGARRKAPARVYGPSVIGSLCGLNVSIVLKL